MHGNQLRRLWPLVVACWSLAAIAQAQNPEEGDVGTGFSGDVGAQGSFGMGANADTSGGANADTMGTGAAPTPSPASTTDSSADTSIDEDEQESDGDSDHDKVIGTFGVGFFGIIDLPLYRQACAGAGGCDAQQRTLSAPTIGMRYWISDLAAIEASVGLGLASNSGQTQMGMTTTTSSSSGFGFALHGGVPLALMDVSHFVFEVVPQLNMGVTSGTLSSPAGDINSSGFLFQAGGTVGAEIHFGFIDLPQLSLQANIGLLIGYQSWSQDQPSGVSWSDKQTTITTLAGEDPWEIMVGNIHAIYYF